jgi:hypothetical protein
MARRRDAQAPLSHDHQKARSLAFRLLHPAPPGPVTPIMPAGTPASRRAEALGFFAAHLAGLTEDAVASLQPAIHARRPPDRRRPR